MTKVAVRVPSYRRHKATGQAVVSLAGRDIYLGKFNSAASRAEYNRLIAEWAAHHGTLPQPSHDLTVTELLAAFITQAPRTHSKKDLENFRLAARPLKSLYGPTSIVEFGPIRLKTVRQQMIDAQLARKTINERINRLRYIFKWGVENEIVPATVLHALQAVAGLHYGRSEAKETEPVKPVPDAFVDAILPHVSPQIAAMVELQRITAMRSGEVTIMRGADIDTSGSVWVYTPEHHKNQWRRHERKIYLGPKAQSIMRPFLRSDLQAYLFAPGDAMLRIWQARHAKRVTPLSHGNRPGKNCRGLLQRKLRDRYDPDSYRRAIEHGIRAANKAHLKAAETQGIPADKVALIPHWHPHRLRHNAGTYLRREFGVETARIILGHRSAAATEIYAELDHARAIDVMAKIG